MALDEETLAKLTTALSGEIELYNNVVNSFQSHVEKSVTLENEVNSYKTKVEELETRNQKYLEQISNLVSKIPVTKAAVPASAEQRFEEIASKAWTK